MKSKLFAILLSLPVMGLSMMADAIVIRHDVPDTKYAASVADFPPLATLYKIGAHGTLIRPQWVVTASHAVFCVMPGDSIKVGNQVVEVEKRYSHSQYKLDNTHDIALLKLKAPISDIKPASTYTGKDELGKQIWFIGVGGTGTGNTGMTVGTQANKGKMRKAQNTIVHVRRNEIEFIFNKGDKALPLEGVSGNGDSGGPAYAMVDSQYYLYGVSSRTSSWFKGVGDYGVKELYTRVSTYNNWINTVIDGTDEQREKITTQNRFVQPDMAGPGLPKLCEKIGF